MTWRGGGAEAVPSMRPASPLQPRTSSSLAQPWSAASHPRTNTCTAPWYHLITCEVINDNHILTTYSVSVLREPLVQMLTRPGLPDSDWVEYRWGGGVVSSGRGRGGSCRSWSDHLTVTVPPITARHTTPSSRSLKKQK